MLGGESPYRSRNWRKEPPKWSGPGEVSGASRTWDKGDNPVGYLGLSSCGSAQAWGGALLSRDPVFVTDVRGVSSCCQVASLVGEGGGEAGWGEETMPLLLEYLDHTLMVPNVVVVGLNQSTYLVLSQLEPGYATVSISIPDSSLSERGFISLEDQSFAGLKRFRDGIVVGNPSTHVGHIGFFSTLAGTHSRISCTSGASDKDSIEVVAGINPSALGDLKTKLIVDNEEGGFRFELAGSGVTEPPSLKISDGSGEVVAGVSGTFSPATLTTVSGLVTGFTAGTPAVFRGARIYYFPDGTEEIDQGVEVILPFNLVGYDEGGFWNPEDPNKLTVPAEGWYHCGANVRFFFSGGLGTLRVFLSVENTTTAVPAQIDRSYSSTGNDTDTTINISGDFYFEEGWTLQLVVLVRDFEDLDVTIPYSPSYSQELWIHRIG